VQGRHVDWPAVGWSVPIGQTPPALTVAHVVQPVAAALTAVQADVVAPPVDHVPAGHEPLPSAVEAPSRQYLPAGQGIHVFAAARL